MLELRDPSLLAENAYINGVWCGAASNETFEVTNPSTGESLARLPNLGVEDARRAIDAAEVAQKDWARRVAKERSGILRKWYELMIDNADDLAAILTAEMGKPLAEAKGEIIYGASFVEWLPKRQSASMGM